MSHFVYSKFGSGKIINSVILSYDQINQSATTTVSSNSYTTIASYNYTPLSDSSNIIVEYYSIYSVNGTDGDSFGSHIKVDATEISIGQQQWTNASGGGTRSGVLFPLMGKYTNSSIDQKTIKVEARRVSSDDFATITGNAGTWLKITEIGR